MSTARNARRRCRAFFMDASHLLKSQIIYPEAVRRAGDISADGTHVHHVDIGTEPTTYPSEA